MNKVKVTHYPVQNMISVFRLMVLAIFMLLAWNTAWAEETAEIAASHELQLKDMNGNDHTLHDFAHQGKWLVIMVWQSDCHVCNQEAESYVAWYEENKSGNATLMGISTDGWENREAAQGFLKEHDVTFPSMLVSYDTLNAFYLANIGQGFFGTPSFLIYSPKGELLAAQTGAVPPDLIDKFIQSNSQQANDDQQPKTSS